MLREDQTGQSGREQLLEDLSLRIVMEGAEMFVFALFAFMALGRALGFVVLYHHFNSCVKEWFLVLMSLQLLYVCDITRVCVSKEVNHAHRNGLNSMSFINIRGPGTRDSSTLLV